MSHDHEHETRVLTATMGFDYCPVVQGGRPTSGAITAAGIPSPMVVSGLLGLAETALGSIIRHSEAAMEWLGKPYPNVITGKKEPLSERSQEALVGLLAQQLMLRQVASRSYTAPAPGGIVDASSPIGD